MMPYRYIPMLIFAMLSTYVGQDFIRNWFIPSEDRGRIVGVPRVVDGDTLVIDRTRIRLHGIDAPEMGQPAISHAGERVDAGALSRFALDELIGGNEIECNWREIDRFNRPIAICNLPDGRDINAAMVTSGMAFAYWQGTFPRRLPTSPEYAMRDLMAGLRKDGFHAFQIASPSAYRAAQRNRDTGDASS